MLKICRQAGCYAKSEQTYCPKHRWSNEKVERRKAFDANRADDPVRKLYQDRRWSITRQKVRGRDPLCTSGETCGGSKASTVVDHHPISARQIVAQFGEAEFFNPARSRGVCKSCHDRKTQREQA